MSDGQEIYSMAEARKKWGKLPSTKKARKIRHQKITKSVDRRSLRATGRTMQFNFRCREGLKQQAQAAAKQAAIPLAEWMELVVDAAIAAQAGGNEKDA